MATVDNFDSYTDGDLSGQGGWSIDASVDVQGTVTQAGAKAITRAGGLGGLDVAVNLDITDITVDGDQISFHVRATVVNDAGGGSWGMTFFTSTTHLFTASLNQDTNNVTIAGATSQSMGSATADTWHKVTVEFDFTNDRARAKLDDGAFTSYVSAIGSAAFANISGIGLRAGGTTGTVYMDTIEDSTGGGGGGAAAVAPTLSLLGVG